MRRHPAFSTALAAAAGIFMLTLLGGLFTPGYSHVSQFISELGASQAAHEYPIRFVGFLPAGVTLLAFCWFAHRALPRASLTSAALIALAVYAAGYCVAAAFPCDTGCRPATPSPSQRIHNLVGGIGYLLAPGFLGIFAWQSRTWPAAARLPIIGLVAALIALAGLLTLSPTSSLVGLSQRAVEVAVLGWVVACGWYIDARSRVAA